MKKTTSIVISICLILSATAFGIVSSSAVSEYRVSSEKYKSQGKSTTELAAAWKTVTDLESADTFVTEPNYETVPYSAGELSYATQDYATSYLNFARYLAGVPSVKWNAKAAKIAQAAAVVNKVNGNLSHEPAKPAGMDQTLYEDGLLGSKKSNISSGRSTLYATIGQGWLNDSDASNIAKLGHRRNFLSPSLPETGFGRAGNHYAGVALGVDNSDYMWELNAFRGTVMYPAPGYFPIQALPNTLAGVGAAWSIHFDRTYSSDKSNFVVTVNNRTKGIITTLTESDKNVNGKYLSKPETDLADIETRANSSLGMISFRVSNDALVVGDEYTITVTGIKDRNGNAKANITYDVCIVDVNNLPTGDVSEPDESSEEESSEPEEPIIPTIKGDTDGDDKITTADALLALRIITGNASASDEQLWAIRVGADDDALPSAVDILLILKKALGLITDFPCE